MLKLTAIAPLTTTIATTIVTTLTAVLTGSLLAQPVQAEIFGDLFLGNEIRTTTNRRTIIITGEGQEPKVIYEQSEDYQPPIFSGSIGWRDRRDWKHETWKHETWKHKTGRRGDRDPHRDGNRHRDRNWDHRGDDRWNDHKHDWNDHRHDRWDRDRSTFPEVNRHPGNHRSVLTFPQTIYRHPSDRAPYYDRGSYPSNHHPSIYGHPPVRYRQFRICTTHINGSRTCN
ncbi:MAG: hypothetical protein VKJ24_06655 [Synechococcales bacterium]|nr:hypothetical protein [Synechococcales bacterium]